MYIRRHQSSKNIPIKAEIVISMKYFPLKTFCYMVFRCELDSNIHIRVLSRTLNLGKAEGGSWLFTHVLLQMLFKKEGTMQNYNHQSVV